MEGIQQVEKIYILREEVKPARKKDIQKALAEFCDEKPQAPEHLKKIISHLESVLNR